MKQLSRVEMSDINTKPNDMEVIPFEEDDELDI
jgi:hypothetical protein